MSIFFFLNTARAGGMLRQFVVAGFVGVVFSTSAAIAQTGSLGLNTDGSTPDASASSGASTASAVCPALATHYQPSSLFI